MRLGKFSGPYIQKMKRKTWKSVVFAFLMRMLLMKNGVKNNIWKICWIVSNVLDAPWHRKTK